MLRAIVCGALFAHLMLFSITYEFTVPSAGTFICCRNASFPVVRHVWLKYLTVYRIF